MIALLVALSFATAASHGHKSAHTHRHKHAPVHAHKHKHGPKHKHAPVAAAEPCSSDAEAVQTLERRIASAEVPQAELNKLEQQLESAIERTRSDCARE
jgi:hypothetical protein